MTVQQRARNCGERPRRADDDEGQTVCGGCRTHCRSKLVPFSRKYILPLDHWLIINLTIFAILWLGMVYGVLHGPQSFREVLVAWAAALFQTWIIVEPSNVLALVLLPSVAEHPWVAKCYACAGEYGFI